MSCGVGHRCSSDLLWLWLWLATIVAPIQPLDWEFLYAAGVALKKKKSALYKAVFLVSSNSVMEKKDMKIERILQQNVMCDNLIGSWIGGNNL